MTPVSDVSIRAVPPPAAERALEASEAKEAQGRKPVLDEYVPEEPREPSGRYWMGRDGDGRPRICFDSPERADGSPEKETKEMVNTDNVDREIEKLKKRRAELERRLSAETDEARIRDLERQLAQVERELTQKDNDAYRKQHAEFTRLS